MIPKFRAWDTFKKNWVKHFFITENGLIYNMEQQHRDLIGAIPIEKSGLILMQSTGLFDNNGVEIFEGDVVNAYDLDRDEGRIFKTVDLVGVVEYKGISFCLKDDRGIYNDLWINAEEYKVIGNIHEHPHLVEAADGH